MVLLEGLAHSQLVLEQKEVAKVLVTVEGTFADLRLQPLECFTVARDMDEGCLFF